MYIDVAVSGAKDRSIGTFTYFSDKNLAPGTFVSVPFGKRKTVGIVIQSTEQPPAQKILPILRILLPFPILRPSQLALLTWLADYYASSVSQMLSLVLPDFTKKLLSTQLPVRHRPQPQILYLVPSHHLLQAVLHRLSTRSDIVVYHGELAPAERAAVYFQVYHNQAQKIIATRTGLFLPFTHLKTIYMYDEHDWGYKETRTPTFHASEVVRALAQIHHAKLEVKDNTPRIQTFYQIKKSSGQDIGLSRSGRSVPLHIAIVNIAQNAHALLSETLVEALKDQLRHKKQILLFLNKRNDGGTLFCRTCKQATFSAIQIDRCPLCKSDDVRFEVLNLKQVSAEVNRLLLLWGISGAQWQTNKEGSEITMSIHNRPLITIATQKILYTAEFRSFNMLGVVQVDTLLNLPEFRAIEKTFALLSQLTGLLKPQSPVIIQTRQPDHIALTSFARHSYGTFVKAELQERKSLGYPPFSVLVLLSFKAQTEATLSRNAAALISRLEQRKKALIDTTVDFTGPYTILHKKTEIRILLKGTDRVRLLEFVRLVPTNWKIDFDPENLVTGNV